MRALALNENATTTTTAAAGGAGGVRVLVRPDRKDSTEALDQTTDQNPNPNPNAPREEASVVVDWTDAEARARTRGVLDWVRAAAEEADGRHEAAAAAYTSALSDAETTGPASARACATRIEHALAGTCDWERLDAWRLEMRTAAEAEGVSPELAAALRRVEAVGGAAANPGLLRFWADIDGGSDTPGRVEEPSGGGNASGGVVTSPEDAVLKCSHAAAGVIRSMLKAKKQRNRGGGIDAARSTLAAAASNLEEPLRLATTLGHPDASTPLLLELAGAHALLAASSSDAAAADVADAFEPPPPSALDVSNFAPWLKLLRTLRVADDCGGGERAAAKIGATRSTLAFTLAIAARRSGNATLAKKLLDETAQTRHARPLLVEYERAKLDRDFTALEDISRRATRDDDDDVRMRARAELKLATWGRREREEKIADGSGSFLEDATAKAFCVQARGVTASAPEMARGWRALASWSEQRAAALTAGAVGGAAFATVEGVVDVDGVCGPSAADPSRDGGGDTLPRDAIDSYAEAAIAYFKYLALDSRQGGDLGSLHAMTRLLAVAAAAAAAAEVSEAFDRGIRTTPSRAWTAVTPHLLSLLRSDAASVRAIARDVLVRVATDAPHAIAYPIAVESAAAAEEAAAACDVSAEEEANDREATARNVANAMLALEAIEPISAALRRASPRLTTDAGVFVAEFGRVCVLHDEELLSSLRDLHADVVKRCALVKEEALRLGDDAKTVDSAAFIERKNAVMMPAIAALDRIVKTSLTGGGFMTPHVAAFVRAFKDGVTAAAEAFKASSDPVIGWRAVKSEMARLARGLQRKRELRLKDVSPALAALKGRVTHAPMPGTELDASAVAVVSVRERVTTLPTKTRPKRVVLLGSDGVERAFLLKGHEDLRLDERAMRALRAVNATLANDADARRRRLCAREYSVTPLVGYGGLIQWVERATPLSAMFGGWQRRTRAANALPPPGAPEEG